MLLTLDSEMAELVTALKWADWTALYTFAVQRDDADAVRYARVIRDTDVEIMQAQPSMRIDHWTIADLMAELLISVAYGFRMSRPTDRHRYTCTLLEAIREYETAPNAAGWVPYSVL